MFKFDSKLSGVCLLLTAVFFTALFLISRFIFSFWGAIAFLIIALVYPVEKRVIAQGGEPYKGRKHWFRFAVVSFLSATACFAGFAFWFSTNPGKSLISPQILGEAIGFAQLFTLFATVIFYSVGKGWYAFVRACRFGFIAYLVAYFFIFALFYLDYRINPTQGKAEEIRLIIKNPLNIQDSQQPSQPVRTTDKRKAVPKRKAATDKEMQ